jgi:hypothetical protein
MSPFGGGAAAAPTETGTLSAREDQRQRPGFGARRHLSSGPKTRRYARPKARVPCGVQTETPLSGGASPSEAQPVCDIQPRSNVGFVQFHNQIAAVQLTASGADEVKDHVGQPVTLRQPLAAQRETASHSFYQI